MTEVGLVVVEFYDDLAASMEERARERIDYGTDAVNAAIRMVETLP